MSFSRAFHVEPASRQLHIPLGKLYVARLGSRPRRRRFYATKGERTERAKFMTAVQGATLASRQVETVYVPPSVLHHGLRSAATVVLAIAMLVLGLFAIAEVNFLAGVFILVGALPLWGWACVQNKDLYSG